MRSLLSLLVFVFSATSFAQMNTYQYQPENKGGTAEVLMSRGQGSFTENGISNGSSVQTDTMQVNVAGSIDETYKYRGGMAFLKRQYSNGQDNYSVAGMGDMNASVWGTAELEALSLNLFSTLTYGVDTTFSLAPGRYEGTSTDSSDADHNVRWRNNVSGYNTYRGFLGSEFAIGKVDWGFRGNMAYYQSRFSSNSSATLAYDYNTWAFGLDSYVELPIYKNTRIGFSAGSEAITTQMGEIANGDHSANLYSSIYAKYKLDGETSFSLSLASQSKNLYYQTETTDLTLGVIRAL
jgi:hypothetical protein